MAYKQTASFKTIKATKPIYSQNSKMKNYNVIYDEEKKQYRSGFYVNNVIKYDMIGTDTVWTIEAGYEGRTDLISNKFFGTPVYDWAIEDINNIEDPIRDIVAGKKILIPSQTKL